MTEQGITWVTTETSKILCCTSSELDRLKVAENCKYFSRATLCLPMRLFRDILQDVLAGMSASVERRPLLGYLFGRGRRYTSVNS